MRRAALIAVVALAAAGCGGTTTVTVTQTVTTTRTVTTTSAAGQAADCTGSDLSATFDVVPNSEGAGNIVYTLTLTNASQSPCSVGGRPQAQLLDAAGAALPTHIVALKAGSGGAKVVLQPGGKATADARFSPDVTGTGDHTTGPCQPQAATLRVTANGGGTVDATIDPPTSVCEQGQLQFDVLAGA